MPALMRCLYCGLLQDEPPGVKVCAHCGGELVFEHEPPPNTYVQAQMYLDQVSAPAGRIVSRHAIVTIQTPAQVPPEEAAPTTAGREPIGFVAVLDVSGSMAGEKIVSVKKAVEQAINRLHDGDTFSLVTFSNQARTVLKPTRVDERLRRKVKDLLRKFKAGGRTALDGGLADGIKAALRRKHETNLVLLLSDGQANVGETNLEMVGWRAFEARQKGVTVSTLGVGSDYNEALMVEIANQGGGRFYHVLHARQIAPYVAGELGEASALAAKAAALRMTLPPGTGIEPFSTAYTVEGTAVNLGDIPTDTNLEVVLRLLLPPQEEGTRLAIGGDLVYRSPAGNELTTPLNTVTLHYVAADEFTIETGAVEPVVRQVLGQMRARQVLQTARTRAVAGASAADEEARREMEELRAYASRLGADAAAEVATEQEQELMEVTQAQDTAATKAVVNRAFSVQRGTKTFG